MAAPRRGERKVRGHLPLLPDTQDVGEDTVQLLGAGRLEEVLEQSKQRRLDGLLLIAQGAAVLLHTGAADVAAQGAERRAESGGRHVREAH